jgi:hypothetical protein
VGRPGAREGIVAATFVALLASLTASEVQASERQPAVRVLNSLPVAAEVSAGYARALFRLWVDADRDGCDTREEVLMDEAVSGVRSGCRVVGGRWVSAYDGSATSNPGSFDIDHLVPLKEAWDSGAWRWDASTRQRFANDLGYGFALIAVTASSNRSKSDRDPAEWLPAQDRCRYVKHWIAVKFRWRLSVDPREKSRLSGLLRGCSRWMVVPSLAPRTIATNEPPAADAPGDGSGQNSSASRLDPRFDTCGDANAAGYGPYRSGSDPEYGWYIDRDRDGLACEP